MLSVLSHSCQMGRENLEQPSSGLERLHDSAKMCWREAVKLPAP